MAGDKSLTQAPESGAKDAESSLFDSAYDVLKSGYDKVAAAFSDGKAAQQLEDKGTIPKVELSDGNKPETKDGKSETKDGSADKGDAARVEKETPKAVLANPEASHEEKLKAALEISKSGEKTFKGEDGRSYDISVTDVGSRQLVSVHTEGDDGRSHAVLRGTSGADGAIGKQRDADGKEVAYVSRWAEGHIKESTLVAGPEKTADKPAEKSDKTEKAEEKVPTAEEFLKAHPELKETAADTKSLAEEKATLEKVQKEYKELTEVRDKFTKTVADLKKEGITELEDEKKFVEQFQKLPPEKRAEYGKRLQEFAPHAQDLQNMDAREKAVERQEARVFRMEKKLSFDEDLKLVDKLPPAERKEVYASIEKLMDKSDATQTTHLTDTERKTITRDLVHQIAHPEDIKQGVKDTCALASSEYVLAKDHPGVYARTVAEMSTTGEVTIHGDGQVASGKYACVDERSIHLNDGNPARSMASKVFQTGAANLALLDDGAHYENYRPGDVPDTRQVKGITPVDESGERIVFNRDGKEIVQDWPGLYPEDQVEVLNRLTGDKYTTEKLHPHTSEQLHEMLKTEGAQHGFPIKVGFLLPDNSGHAVTITGIDDSRSPPVVKYEDPAKPRGATQELSMKDFYRLALKGPTVYAVGDMKLTVLGAGKDADPYIEIIHR